MSSEDVEQERRSERALRRSRRNDIQYLSQLCFSILDFHFNLSDIQVYIE